jgi:hypothetical protein
MSEPKTAEAVAIWLQTHPLSRRVTTEEVEAHISWARGGWDHAELRNPRLPDE